MKSASQSEDRRTFSRWSAPTTKTNQKSRKSTRNSPFDLGLIPVSFRFETRASRTLLNRLHRRMPQSSIYFRRTVLPIHLKIDAMQIELEAENGNKGVHSKHASVYIFSKLIGIPRPEVTGCSALFQFTL